MSSWRCASLIMHKDNFTFLLAGIIIFIRIFAKDNGQK
jgi:hypothetical protein